MRCVVISRVLRLCAAVLGVLGFIATSRGQVDNASNPAAPPPTPTLESAEDFSGSPLGTLGGLRPLLGKEGIKISGIYTGEIFGNVSGGLRTGAVADGLLELDLDVDLKTALGLPGGSLHLGGFDIHGPSLTRNYTGDLSTVSSIDAYDTIRFAEYWYQQTLWDERFSLKLGQFFTENEFYYSDYGNLFICGTFGAFTFLANNFPFAPNYPMSAPGARVLLRVVPDVFDLRGAIYSGSTLSESENNRSFPHIAGRDGVFTVSEAVYLLNHRKDARGLPGTYKFGAFFHSRYDGELNANPRSIDRSEYGLYLVGDQTLWRKEVDSDNKSKGPAFGVFARLGYAPEDVSFVSRYAEGGFNFNGLFPGRADDIFGVGVTHSNISDVASRLSARAGGPRYDAETVIETTYSVSVEPWLKLQPDFQYIIEPGARQGAHDAVVLGLRTNLTF